MTRSFSVERNAAGGWRLRLLEYDESGAAVEAGGGAFPYDEYGDAIEMGQSWAEECPTEPEPPEVPAASPPASPRE